jgi:hypothetical protein
LRLHERCAQSRVGIDAATNAQRRRAIIAGACQGRSRRAAAGKTTAPAGQFVRFAANKAAVQAALHERFASFEQAGYPQMQRCAWRREM